MKLFEMLDRWGEISDEIREEFEGREGTDPTPFATYVKDYTSDESLPLDQMSGPLVEYVLRMIHKWGTPDDLAFALDKVGC